MSEDPSRTVDQLLRRAAELPETERMEFLESEVGDDPELRRSLHSTLASLDDDDGFLQTGGAMRGPLFAGMREPVPGHRSGERIGPYKLIEKLGSGGMGEVWRASQLEPVQREVAIKLIRPGMDSEQVLTRFRVERQALAMMSHGSIARIYDAGVTEAGRPYFAMELVRGAPITEFCEARRLSTRERVELFVDVCAAVEHAHKRGILHRDLKPSNILLTVEGDRRIPKVIDFGIAKAMGGADSEAAQTRIGQWIGTPEYMSPEQADLSPHEIDTRTDVYSLGAVLYEVLTGCQLFDDVTGLRESHPDEIRRRIREDEPSRPSDRVSRQAKRTGPAAGRGRTGGRTGGRAEGRLVRALEGDLDWIAMKALEKERERRYGSARELAEDLERHLRGEPVLAGPPTLRYRVEKFVRRHRLAVVTTTLIALSLILATAVATVGLFRAREAERVARTEAAKATEINRFLRGMLASARPEGGVGREVTVVEALEQARESIETGFTDAPEVRADLLSVMGGTYLELGLFQDARTLLEEALAMRRELFGDASHEVAETLNELARLEHTSGHLEEAEAYFTEVLDTLRTLGPGQEPRIAATLNNLGMLLVHRGRQDEALAMLSEALEAKRALFGDVHEEVVPTLNNLGLLLSDMGRYDEAEPYLVEAIEGNKQLHGPEHGLVAINMNNLATLYSDRGDFERAEETFREVLELKKKAFGEDHTSYGITLSNFAQLLDREGKYTEAGPLHERALAIYRRTLDPLSHRIGTARVRYGYHLLRSGRLAEAETELSEGTAILEAAFGPADARVVDGRRYLEEIREDPPRGDGTVR